MFCLYLKHLHKVQTEIEIYQSDNTMQGPVRLIKLFIKKISVIFLYKYVLSTKKKQ